MGRWRPPPEKSSPYISALGAKLLRAELRQLWSEERPEVVKALSAAAAEGDRSENAEYIYRKKQLAGIDRRIRYLNKRLANVVVVNQPPTDATQVRFGAKVTLEDDEGHSVSYRIVGADETNAECMWISIDSPVAKALLGKSVDDDILVSTPDGSKHWYVLDVSYPTDLYIV